VPFSATHLILKPQEQHHQMLHSLLYSAITGWQLTLNLLNKSTISIAVIAASRLYFPTSFPRVQSLVQLYPLSHTENNRNFCFETNAGNAFGYFGAYILEMRSRAPRIMAPKQIMASKRALFAKFFAVSAIQRSGNL